MLYRSGSRIEHFGHQDMSINYQNDLDAWSFDTSAFRVGPASVTAADTSEIHQTLSTDGIPNLPAQGDEIDVWFRSNLAPGSGDGSTIGMYFGLTDNTGGSENGYRVMYQMSESDLLMQRMDDGARTNLDFDLSAYTGRSANEWVRVNIKWDDGNTFGGNAGDFTVEVFDTSGTSQSDVFTVNDTTYSPAAGQIGWLADVSGSGQVWADKAVMTTHQGTGSPTLTTVDSFEDGNVGEYNGSTQLFAVSSNFSTDGSNGLESTGHTSGGPIVSADGLGQYPSKATEIQADWESSVSTSGTSDVTWSTVLFGVADTDNWYGIRVRIENGDFRILNMDGGSLSSIDGGAITLSENISADTTYTTRIRWDDGSTFGGNDNDITVDILDSSGTSLGTGTANDSTHATNTGVGFRTILSNSSDVLNWDHYRATNTVSQGTLIEGFEDGNLTGYTASAGFTTNASSAHEGNLGLEVDSNSNPAVCIDTGIGTSTGNTYTFWANHVTHTSNSRGGLYIHAQSEGDGSTRVDGYTAIVNLAGGNAAIQKQESGTTTDLDTQSINSATDTYTEVDFTTESDGSLTLEFTDPGGVDRTLTATDTTFSSGGLGFLFSNFGGSTDIYHWDTVIEDPL